MNLFEIEHYCSFLTMLGIAGDPEWDQKARETEV